MPINQIPPEILSLVPYLWSRRSRDREVIMLTRVCRAWGVFMSCASLWPDKARASTSNAQSPLRTITARPSLIPFSSLSPAVLGDSNP